MSPICNPSSNSLILLDDRFVQDTRPTVEYRAKAMEETKSLIEDEFEYVTDFGETKLFRKRE
jgi:hypothetical protein